MNEIDEIRQEMARIRHDLHEDVTGVVGGASEAMAWRAQLRAHPWLASGAAFLIGYLLVPKRSKPAEVARIPTPVPSGVMSASPVGASPSADTLEQGGPSFWRVMGWVVSFAGPIAISAAQAYASVWLENQLGIRPKGPGGPESDGPRDRANRPAQAKESRAGVPTSSFGSGRGFPG